MSPGAVQVVSPDDVSSIINRPEGYVLLAHAQIGERLRSINRRPEAKAKAVCAFAVKLGDV